ncbi:MAG: dihydrodipicolinate synthase family protein, partial [Armatimonadetes bacterium]|nr:dihydrodipicolinate synthase family protein [Armatimonadota bacterium]
AARSAAGRLPVVAMANHPGLPLAVELAKRMAAAGADIIGLNLPRAFGVREDDLFRYAVAVAEATDLPFLVQDWNPGGGTVGPDFCVRLRERCPNFGWIKLEEPRMGPKMTAIHRATNQEVGVLEGWGGLFMPELMPHGCVGSMPGLAVCDVLVKVWDHLAAGDLYGAFGPFSEVMPYIYFSLENFEVYHHLEKRILVARGALAEAHVRDLTTHPDEYDTSYFEFLLAKLRETIERYGLAWRAMG